MDGIAALPAGFRRRREKVFGEGRCQPLDRNAKARIMVYARAWSARHRRPGQQRGPRQRAKSGHKAKRPLSEKAYLSGRRISFAIQLKKMHFWQQAAEPFLDTLRRYRKQGFAAAAGRNCGKSKSRKTNAFLFANSL